MTVRTLVFWPHLVAGVAVGAVVFVMALTGVLLTYERQLIAWDESRYRSTAPEASARRLGLMDVLDHTRAAAAGEGAIVVTVAADPAAPVVVTAGGDRLYLDAYSGALLGRGGRRMRTFLSRVRAWHRWLAVDGEGRPVARVVTGWSNLLFAFLVITGAYLWLPRTFRWPQFRAVALFRRGASGKARDFNWHHVIGVWCAVPLLVVVVCAVPISFPWANAALYRALGETPPAGREARGAAGPRGEAGRRTGESGTGLRRARGDLAEPGRLKDESAGQVGDLDLLLARAKRHARGWQTIGFRVPESADAPVAFTIDRGDGGQPHLRSTVTLARQSGDVMSVETFSSLSAGRRIRSVMRFAHTGEVLGLPGQTMAGLASAGALLLVWTGFALAWRRLSAWTARRSSAPAAERQRPSPAT